MNKPHLILLVTLISGVTWSAPLPPAISPAGIASGGRRRQQYRYQQQDRTLYFR